jgi:hypothetical protein
MFGRRLRQAQRIARHRYCVQLWPYLYRTMPADFNPYRRQVVGFAVLRWTTTPVGHYRKSNGAHGRWCCTAAEYAKMKGWRKRRAMWLRAMVE